MTLVTHQTGPQGRVVRRLLIEETLPIERELYLAILVDRPGQAAGHGVGFRRHGDRAGRGGNPDAIIKEHIDPAAMAAFQARKIAFALGLQGRRLLRGEVYAGLGTKCLPETDASMLEINPLITTKDGRLFALDAKITFEDNALFRHADLKELRDITEEDPLEVEASKYSLNYIKLEGNVGCMVNGAGLPWRRWTYQVRRR